jgi:hypothetical protein
MRSDEEILKKFLEIEAKKVLKRIEKKGKLDTKDASVLSLKYLFNHVSELEEKMATKDDIKRLEIATKDDIKRLEKEIKNLKWMLGLGIAFLTLLTGISMFIK